MKFSLESKQVVLPSSTETTPTVESISYAYEGLLTSYMELTDTQKNLDEVCQVMENIELSMAMIKAGGMDAVKLLNIDKSLETLLGVAEEKISLQAAEEGLGTTVKDLAKKFWETVKQWISKFVGYIKSLFSASKKQNDAVKETIERATEFDPFKKVSPFNKNVLKDILELKNYVYSASDLVGNWFKRVDAFVTSGEGENVRDLGILIENDIKKLAGIVNTKIEWSVSFDGGRCDIESTVSSSKEYNLNGCDCLNDAGIKSKQEAIGALKICEDIIGKLNDIDTHIVQMNTVANKMAGGGVWSDGDMTTVQNQKRVVFFTLKVSSNLLNTIHHFMSLEIRTLHSALTQALSEK